jgi:TonB family protein
MSETKKEAYQDTVHKPFGVLLASKPPKLAGRTGSSLVALGFHAIVGAALVYATLQTVEEIQEEEVYVELTPQTFVPPPPPPPPPPSVEVPQMEQVQGFKTLQIPTVIPAEIPPPAKSWSVRASDFLGEGVPGGIGNGRRADSTNSVASPDRNTPSFTPHTVKPGLTNGDDVQRALVREYPAMLRDAQIGGTVVVWLFIDVEGRVENSKVQTSSGYPMLDAAALNVANTMRFTPAYNRDQKVPVWVSIPITFRVG